MYLKQIEIHGFKSFANDTILTFEKGITGIVGPNGSGKSNIADAVRWVLGERSMKQLRGADTLDVIFSGTELRKAQGFAYVNLIIDNTDKKIPISYDEIQVSRRLYRSGESEYKLNNVDCRLKDINELFYDTGIGKEGYSIIGQGQIDKILSDKPEDRRELFDEAVGIVKYKRRKIIAERKLEEEKLNLSRVTDIINEIDRQIGPLKKQAEAAKNYLDLRDDLLLYESNYFIREVDAESSIIEDTNNKIEINKNDINELKNKKLAFNEKYNEIENKITNLDLEIAELRDVITEDTALAENIKGQINVLKEQINFEKNSYQNKLERIENYNKDINRLVSELKNDISTLYMLEKQIDFIKTNNTEMEESDDQFSNDVTLINETFDKVKEAIVNYSLSIDLKDINNSTSIFSNDFSIDSSNNNKGKLAEIENDINTLLKTIDESNINALNTSNKLDSVINELQICNNTFNTNLIRLDNLRNIIEKNEGYPNAVKNVLDNKSKFNGIIGSVADIIETKKEYETAIEIALGNSIQNIVTDNVETSKNIINYLREYKLGRVTTLPLSEVNFKENKIYEDSLKEKGVIDLAVNLVNFDKKYEILANYLLKNCLVVDNYDSAKVIFRNFKSGIKIVTLNGELFNPGGAISGGTYKNSLSLIGRKREFENLQNVIKNDKENITKLTEERNGINSKLNEINEKIEKDKARLNELNIEKNTLTLNIINDMKLEYSNISNKTKFLTDNIFKEISNVKTIFDEKNSFEKNEYNFEEIIKEKEGSIAKLDIGLKDLENKISVAENNINAKNLDKNSNLSNRKEFYDAKDKLTTEQISLEQESNRLQNILEKSNQKIKDLTNSMLENYNLTYATAKEKYDDTLGTNEEIIQKVKEKRKVIQELGPININAIEEYRQVGERYDVMTTQYEDIKKSEEMIAKIVDELDESMRNKFNENFQKIKTEFESVFKILFGGGKANIELVETDEKGVLDAGVALIVQPPGKKLGNMMQLSGGEKALTAIALLFAIQNLKPSPFCLLDEIEAALDESNVDRFADYLKKLTKETQFILITHRRGTMEKADRLYGITMQEKGITALVSVNLIEDQLS